MNDFPVFFSSAVRIQMGNSDQREWVVIGLKKKKNKLYFTKKNRAQVFFFFKFKIVWPAAVHRTVVDRG